ncbi:MAG TPA: hypothetical protein VK610_00260 [Rhodothermales bacterium]|nr:hypothetical protein [Rhodothermales bacterium]
MAERGNSWIERYERAGWLERIGLLGGGAVRLTAGLIETAVDRAAKTVAEAEAAFRKELDPNVSDAKVLDEWEEPKRRPDDGR